MPEIIFYIVTGFFFIKVFHFTALKKNSPDVEHILTVSLVIGFVICKLMELIPFTLGNTIDTIGIILTAILSGYILGLLFQYDSYIYKVLEKLGIRNSLHEYIWDDITDWVYPNKLIVHYPDKTFTGYVHYLENYSNAPSVSLAGYMIEDNNKNIIIDNSFQENKVVFVELLKADYVEVEYYKESAMCDDVKALVSNNINDGNTTP